MSDALSKAEAVHRAALRLAEASADLERRAMDLCGAARATGTETEAQTGAQTDALAAVVAAEHSARRAMIAVTVTLHEATRAR
mgnify:CR=1 FL=1